MRIPFLFLLLVFIGKMSTVLAQEVNANFHRFSLDQGLSMNYINCIGQDQQGFIWVGTGDGLNKFDGYKFTTYRNRPGVEGSISNSLILSVYADRQGILYVGTNDGGLNIYDREKDNFSSFQNDPKNPSSIVSNRVNVILEDRQGVIWVGTENGLDAFDRKTKAFTHYLHDSSSTNNITSNMVRALVEDKNGNLWIGTEGGISVLSPDRKNFHHFHHQKGNSRSLSRNPIRSLFIDSKENVWIGTAFGGVNLFHPATQDFSHLKNSSSGQNSILGNYIPGITEDKDGNIWFATNYGISVLNKKTNSFTNYQRDHFDNSSLVDNGLNTIFKDRDDNIWIGSIAGLTVHEGLPPKFEHVFHNPGNGQSLGDKEVFCFFEDPEGKIWVGLRVGFDLYDPQKKAFTHFTHFPNGQKIPTVTSIYQDRLGDFWLGMDEGIARYNFAKGTFDLYTSTSPENPSSTPIRDVWYMQEDTNGDLYISSYMKSIFRFNRKKNSFELFVWDKKGIEDIDPTSFYIDGQNNFWIGSAREGLLKVNKEKNIFIRYKANQQNTHSISNNHILVIFEDSKSNFWVGTKGGLNRMDTKDGSFTTYTEADGLPNTQVNAIEEDESGNLWISTNNGVSCFDPKKKKFKNYDMDDGLQHNEFWPRASIKLSSGKMLFGGINGFNVIDLSKIKFNQKVPAVFITDFQIFNKPVEIGTEDSPLSKNISETEEIILSHRQSVFSFEFVALNFVVSKKNQFAYIMEGFEEDWNYLGTHHKATYTNLDPGKYTFRVKASNNDGVWNETGTSLSIIIEPPFYKTWWFKLSGAMVSLIFLYFGLKVKTNHINQENKRLEAGVSERTREIERQKQELASNRDELKHLNQEISNQNEALEKKVEERTQDLLALNLKLTASEEQLRKILDQTLEINQKLSLSEARLAEAQHIARMGNLELHLKNQRFCWSEETYRIFGLEQAKFTPSYEKVLNLIQAPYKVIFQEAVQEAVISKKSFEIEIQIRKATNTFCWVLLMGKPAQNQQGEVDKIVAIIIDTTERKLAEEQLRFQNQELLKINAELDRFVYCASHDLRAPLSSLLGLINIFKIENNKETKDQYLALMQKSIHKLDTFIQSIISYSKNSRLEIKKETIDFQELVNETKENLQYMESSKRVDIRFSLSRATPFESDAFRLKIIFNNLLSNAIRYSNPYAASFVDIRIEVADKKATIEFRDNGCGIAKENLDKVFEMFYRASETNVGSGLGLYIVKEVITSLKGTVEVHSVLGKGTSIKIDLPNLLHLEPLNPVLA